MNPGTTLGGRYDVREPVGHGGMGRVWRAYDASLERDVAIKTVDLAATPDPEARERFRREAVAAATIAHPNIVTVFDVGLEESTAYLVMELLQGDTAEELIAKNGALPVPDALRIVTDALAGTAAAHDAGVVHRDLKPANLFVADGVTKVLDFGIAQLAQTEGGGLTATGTLLGTAAYLAPEQARGERATTRSDLYSLGCALFALLVGRPPFTSEHPMGYLHQHVGAPVPRLRDFREDAPADVEEFLLRLMAKEPEDRPATAEEAREQSQALLVAHALAGSPAASLTELAKLPLPPALLAAIVNTPVPGTTPTHPAPARTREEAAGLATQADLAGTEGAAVSPATQPHLPVSPATQPDLPVSPAPQPDLPDLGDAPPPTPPGPAASDPAEPQHTAPLPLVPDEPDPGAPPQPPAAATAGAGSRSRDRRTGLMAAAAVGAVLLALVVWQLADSPPPSTQVPDASLTQPGEPPPGAVANAPAGAETDAAGETGSVEPTPSWSAAVDSLRASVVAAEYSGDRAEGTERDLTHAVDALTRWLEQGKPDKAQESVDELTAILDGLDGETIDAESRESIRSAVAAVAAATGLQVAELTG